MEVWSRTAALAILLVTLIQAQEQQAPVVSKECEDAEKACEADTDCLHRLSALHATCVTNTCQPQCRSAVLNLYQTKLGRGLLRTDMSCLLGPRQEMELCDLVPNGSTLHCTLAKLACEADMLCQAKLDVFVAECEADVSERKCTEKCARRFADTLKTTRGAAFSNCTCWRQDPLCDHLNDHILSACMERATALIDADSSNFTRTNSVDAAKDAPSVAPPSGNGTASAKDDANIASLPAFTTLILSSLTTIFAMLLRR
uniref:GDNF/GAS1 domain-containing protein n=1 Tax=Plectus sambesii TaxID=2011161 RepID=A0A914VV59_9BILA